MNYDMIVKGNASIPEITSMLSELLSALGFGAMAEDVKSETDAERIRRYARVVAKHANDQRITTRLQLLNLM